MQPQLRPAHVRAPLPRCPVCCCCTAVAGTTRLRLRAPGLALCRGRAAAVPAPLSRRRAVISLPCCRCATAASTAAAASITPALCHSCAAAAATPRLRPSAPALPPHSQPIAMPVAASISMALAVASLSLAVPLKSLLVHQARAACAADAVVPGRYMLPTVTALPQPFGDQSCSLARRGVPPTASGELSRPPDAAQTAVASTLFRYDRPYPDWRPFVGLVLMAACSQMFKPADTRCRTSKP